jgi:ABC-type multidrug transport system fused ATPase/permease subunit
VHLTSGEKRLLVAACVAALVLGAFAGYVAYALEEEHQFHGGVLEEDATQAMWHLRWAAAEAFAQVGVLAFLVIAVVPLSLRRLLSGRSR